MSATVMDFNRLTMPAIPASTADEEVVCTKCGSMARALKLPVGNGTITLCAECRRQESEAEARQKLESQRASLRAEPPYQRCEAPPRYRDCSLAADFCLDARAYGLPDLKQRPSGVFFATHDSQLDAIRFLRGFRPAGAGARARAWIVIEGKPGRGKSHLAAAWLFDHIRESQSRSCYWFRERDAAELMRTRFKSEDRKAGEKMLKRAREASILVWDDFLYGNSQELVRAILSFRYDSERPTLFTTQLPQTRIREWFKDDGANYGRLVEMTAEARGGRWFRIEGEDCRLAG